MEDEYQPNKQNQILKSNFFQWRETPSRSYGSDETHQIWSFTTTNNTLN